MTIPFEHAKPVLPNAFIGRDSEVRRLHDCIKKGESCVIIGEPRVGKTSILNYILLGSIAESEGFFVSYVDGHSHAGQFVESTFWDYAFRCFKQKKVPRMVSDAFVRVFKSYNANQYSRVGVENVLRCMSEHGMRLVLLVDEFDAVVKNTTCHADFFSWLRSLVQRPDLLSALSVVVASRLSPMQLEMSLHGRFYGSPPFNHMTPIPLGAFKADEIEKLLDRAPGVFGKAERKHLIRLTGGYPHIIQIAAAEFCFSSQQGKRSQLKDVDEKVLFEARRLLSDVWHHWPDSKRIAFISVAVEHLEYIRNARASSSLPSAHGFNSVDQTELQMLAKTGFTVPDKRVVGGYRVSAQAFLVWLLTQHATSMLQNWAQGSTLARGLLYRMHAMSAAVNASDSDGLLGRRNFQNALVASQPRVVRVFISFTTKDTLHLQRFCQLLAPLEQRGLIELWSSEKIEPGHTVEEALKNSLLGSQVIVPLISPDYLASEQHMDKELNWAWTRHQCGKARVVPILVRPVASEILCNMPFSSAIISTEESTAVSEYASPDKAWKEIGDKIYTIIRIMLDG